MNGIPPSNRGDPWFEDGNIILLVEDDDHKMLKAFKVHRGVLARQSEVFETMFDIPQPTASMDSVEQIDGCPVVRMYDRPNELSDLIKALYDGAWVIQPLLIWCRFRLSLLLKQHVLSTECRGFLLPSRDITFIFQIFHFPPSYPSYSISNRHMVVHHPWTR
jgi:hypothetical protein